MLNLAKCTKAIVVLISMCSTVAALGAAPQATTISCNRLCPTCGQKIATTLRAMPGVVDAQVQVEAKALVIIAQPQVVLSPRALWETVERGGEQPLRLSGPSGTFTEKPQF